MTIGEETNDSECHLLNEHETSITAFDLVTKYKSDLYNDVEVNEEKYNAIAICMIGHTLRTPDIKNIFIERQIYLLTSKESIAKDLEHIYKRCKYDENPSKCYVVDYDILYYRYHVIPYTRENRTVYYILVDKVPFHDVLSGCCCIVS